MKKLFLLFTACILAGIVYGQSPIVIYDGESVNPNWGTVGATAVTNDVTNPYKTGINTSDKVIKVERHYTDEWFAGARVWNQSINPALYNKISFMLWKNVAGNVKIELQHQDGSNETNKFSSEQVWHNGTGWEKIEFNISHCDVVVLNNVLIVVHDADLSSDPSFGTKDMYIDNVEASFDPNLTWYASYNTSAVNEIVLYNGDDLKPWWGDLSSTVNRDAVNPLTDGINASTGCVSITRKANGNYTGGYNWSGGALWGWERLYLSPTQYNRFSLMVLKPIAGKVQLEIQQVIPETKGYIIADYTTPGQWQKLEFDASSFSGSVINNILVEPHSQDYAGEDMTIYWDNLTAYINNTATGMVSNNNDEFIVRIDVYTVMGVLIKTVKNSAEISLSTMKKGLYLIKKTDISGNTKCEKIFINNQN